MAFSDYSATPASNTTIGGAIFIGPNMQRGDVREALQQLAADGRSLSDVVVDAGLLTATPPENYFTTRAAGAAATATDALFSSDEEGAMAVYRRTGVVPNYTKLYEVATKAQVDAKAATATLSASSGSAGIGSVRSEAGATAMTMEARVRQQFALVGDFGIVGTEVGGGAQNDRTALIAALNCGATFLIPEDFTIRSAAAITSADLLVPFNVLGQSRTTSRVFFDVNGVGLTTTTSAARSQWDNLTIYGNLANANSAGLKLYDNGSRPMSRLEMHLFNQVGIEFVDGGCQIVDDVRAYTCGTGLKFSPSGGGVTFSPIVRDFYMTGTNGVPGPRTTIGIEFVGNCVNPTVDHCVIEYCLAGIKATSVLNVTVKNPDFEANTDDYLGIDSCFNIECEQSTASGHTLTFPSFPAHQKFLWKRGPQFGAVGGMRNSDTRTPAAADIWYGLEFNTSVPSPYVQPNPGGTAAHTIQIVTPGLYRIKLKGTFATASAVAGWGNIRVLKNTVEIPGAFGEVYIPAVTGASGPASCELIVEFATGDLIKAEYGSSNTQVRIAGRLGGFGPAPTLASNAVFTVEHLGMTSALTL